MIKKNMKHQVEKESAYSMNISINFQKKDNKIKVTTRLDQDTYDWFKQKHPKGFQTRINAALRAFLKIEKFRDDISYS